MTYKDQRRTGHMKYWSWVLFCPVLAMADLNEMNDQELSVQTGQGGVSVSADLSINPEGGPLWKTPGSNQQNTWASNERSCAASGSSQTESCGMRIANQMKENGRWMVIDDLKGSVSFENMTLQTKTISDGFGGDGAGFKNDVLQVGLPSEVRFKELGFDLASANDGGWRNNQLSVAQGGNPSFQQTNMISTQLNGTMRMQGNMLVFPSK